MTNRHIGTVVLCLMLTGPLYAQESALSVDKIMQDPDSWIESWPGGPFWSQDGQMLAARNPSAETIGKAGRWTGNVMPGASPPAHGRSFMN